MSVLQTLGSGKVNMVEFQIAEAAAGHQVVDLVMPGESNVVPLVRDGRARIGSSSRAATSSSSRLTA